MSIDAPTRTIGSRTETPEEGLRLSIYADIRKSGADVTGFLETFAHVVNNEIWKKLRDKDGNPLTFRQFIELPYPVGVGSSVEQVKKIVLLKSRHETHPETAANLAAMRAKVRALTEEESREVIKNGGDRRGDGSSLTCQTEQPSGQGGNSRAYSIARLKRDRPDLADMVIAGELSANAAAVEAGFRKRDTPLDALRRAWGKATEDERATFMTEIEVG